MVTVPAQLGDQLVEHVRPRLQCPKDLTVRSPRQLVLRTPCQSPRRRNRRLGRRWVGMVAAAPRLTRNGREVAAQPEPHLHGRLAHRVARWSGCALACLTDHAGVVAGRTRASAELLDGLAVGQPVQRLDVDASLRCGLGALPGGRRDSRCGSLLTGCFYLFRGRGGTGRPAGRDRRG